MTITNRKSKKIKKSKKDKKDKKIKKKKVKDRKRERRKENRYPSSSEETSFSKKFKTSEKPSKSETKTRVMLLRNLPNSLSEKKLKEYFLQLSIDLNSFPPEKISFISAFKTAYITYPDTETLTFLFKVSQLTRALKRISKYTDSTSRENSIRKKERHTRGKTITASTLHGTAKGVHFTIMPPGSSV